MPTLSIILPIYNGEHFIHDTISNLLSQTYRDFELIAINDGSTDNSLSIIESYAKKDSRVIVINKKNEGICKTRNKGIETAKGKFLVFIDQDDKFDSEIHKDYVETITTLNADLCIFGSTHTNIDSKGKEKDFKIVPKERKRINNEEERYRLIYNADNDKFLTTIWNCVYTKRVIDEHNLRFSENLKKGNEDTIFNMQFSRYAKDIYLIPTIHYHYYLRTGISTYTKYNENIIEDIKYIADVANRLLPSESLASQQMMLNYFVFRLVRVAYSHIIKRRKKNRIEKVEVLRKILDNRQFINSCTLCLTDYKINCMYKLFNKILSYSLRKKYYYLSSILLDLSVR